MVPVEQEEAGAWVWPLQAGECENGLGDPRPGEGARGGGGKRKGDQSGDKSGREEQRGRTDIRHMQAALIEGEGAREKHKESGTGGGERT